MTTHRLLYLLDAAKLHQGSAASLPWRHPHGDPFLSHHIDAGLNLIVELAFNLSFAKEVSRGTLDSAQEFHHVHLSCRQCIRHGQDHSCPLLCFDLKLALSCPGE